LTKNNYTGKGPTDANPNQESQRKREQSCRDLLHEFTNAVTAVIGYSELALHETERSHPAREWLEKIRNHTKQIASLLRRLTVSSSGTKRVTNDEC